MGFWKEPAGRGCVYAGLPAGRDADLAAVGPRSASGAPAVRDGERGRGDPLWANAAARGVGAAGGAATGRADMFVVGPDTSSDSNHTSWVLDARRPPQYGSWPTPPEFLRDAPPGAASPAAAPPGFRERRLQILRVQLQQGTISQEEYEQHLREIGLDEDQGLLPNVPKLLRKLSCQASTTRPWGGRSAGRRRRAAVLRHRARFLPGSGRRAVSPGGAGRGSPQPGRSRPP
jgi:hypothetical protein